MTVRQGAALSIRIEVRDKTRIVVRDDKDVVRVDVTTEFSRSQLEDVHGPLREELDRFRTDLALVEQSSIRTVTDALLRLQTRGRSILLDLFKGRTEARKQTVFLCQQACPNWEKPRWEPTAPAPRLITVRVMGGVGIPIEMLPLIEQRTPDNLRGDLARVAASFLGFSAIVKREITTSPLRASLPRLDNHPQLPMKIFISRDLGGASEDDRYLRSNPSIDLDTAWPPPNAPNTEKFCAELARHLWRADQTIAGTTRTPPVQICHFSCHCDTTKPYSSQFSLKFYARPMWGKREVTLESLRDQLMALRDDQEEAGLRSLVFVNACGSAGLYPSGASSFPDLFLNNDLGFLGFIGTETTVPDGFANLFTKTFYNYLLDAWPVGRALHATRWEILHSKRNPLGIIYSLYAEPEIQARVPKPNPIPPIASTPSQ